VRAPHEEEQSVMIAYLKALAARLAGRVFDRFPPPDELELGVSVPRRSGPGGRSSAIALDEPRDDRLVRAMAAASGAMRVDDGDTGRSAGNRQAS
jgi:hypothetical protein